MHDLVIRGGIIIDGTGASRETGDIAIKDGKLAEVGGKIGPGRREIDADGLLVTPGWVDIHTHYDGQATWDPELASSSWNGSTTILFGNCGVGFAPVRAKHHDALIDLMEGVEDIPGIALAEGLSWDWESFPEYLDALERQERVIDVGAQMPHHALRVYVMGERAIRHEAATAEDIKVMAKLTEEALLAGAFGFTTSRTDSHKTTSGDFVPGRYSETEELIGIGRSLGKVGRGAFGMISDFEDEEAEFKWMRELGAEIRRPIWFLLTDRSHDPERWKRLMAGAKISKAQGASITAQIAGRSVGLILGLTTSLTPFSVRSSFNALENLSQEDKLAKLRDPVVRSIILKEEVSADLLSILPPLTQAIATRWDRMYPLGDPPNYEPTADQSVQALAGKEGKSPEEFAYDYLTGGDGNRKFLFPVTNYVSGDLEPVREMLADPDTLLGLSDGGAHVGLISDASVPSFMLSHWGRDRSRGDKFAVEWLVKRQTSETADFFGFTDRGRLQIGKKADLNIIDFDNLRPRMPEIVNDLPAGGKRLVQRVDGYEATIVSGEPIFEKGESTGARPGKLVRSVA